MSAGTSWQSCCAVGTAPWSAIWARISASSVGRLGPHFDQRKAGIGARLADRDLLDPKRPAAGRDQVEDLGQDQAVDDVAANFTSSTWGMAGEFAD